MQAEVCLPSALGRRVPPLRPRFDRARPPWHARHAPRLRKRKKRHPTESLKRIDHHARVKNVQPMVSLDKRARRSQEAR